MGKNVSCWPIKLFSTLILVFLFSAFAQAQGITNPPANPGLHASGAGDDIASSVAGALAGSEDLSQSRSVSGNGSSRNNTPQRTPCQILYDSGAWTLRDIDYMGVSLAEVLRVHHCIDARTDGQARRPVNGNQQCPNAPPMNGRIINMGNPQYFSESDAARLRQLAIDNGLGDGTLDRDTNPFGIYLCVTRDRQYEKSAVCNGMNNNQNIRSRSRWPAEVLDRLQFRWRSSGDGDGDCECANQGSSDWRLCTRPEDVPSDPCAEKGMLADTRPVSERTPGVTSCQCTRPINEPGRPGAPFEVVYIPLSESCEPEPVVTEATPPPTEPTAALKQCVESWTRKANHCKTVADTARTACAASDAQNRPANQGIEALSSANNFHNQVRSGSGAQNECFQASLVSSAAINTVQGRQQGCDDEFNSCVSSCIEQNAETFERACSPLVAVNARAAEIRGMAGISTGVAQNALEMQRAARQSALNQEYYNTHRDAIRAEFVRSGEVCSGDVRQQRSLTDRTLSSLGDSLSQSTRCMCQLSAAGGNCDTATPTVAECAANPTLPSCSIYQALNACAPGSNYNATACNCELNPMTAGCRTGTTSSLTNFAGAGARLAAAAAVGAPSSVATANGSPIGSGVDLSGTAAEDAAQLASGDSSGSADGGAPSVAGGGLGSGSGVGAAVAGTEGVIEEAQSGLKGLFNSAKTFMSKFSGGKGGENGKVGEGARVGPNGFPRGLASERGGLGKKNVDIWKLMNSCVQGETCRANQNNYITSP